MYIYFSQFSLVHGPEKTFLLFLFICCGMATSAVCRPILQQSVWVLTGSKAGKNETQRKEVLFPEKKLFFQRQKKLLLSEDRTPGRIVPQCSRAICPGGHTEESNTETHLFVPQRVIIRPSVDENDGWPRVITVDKVLKLGMGHHVRHAARRRRALCRTVLHPN